MKDRLRLLRGMLQTGIRQYQYHGASCFERVYTTYSVENKRKGLHYRKEDGTSIRETAAIFNIPTQSLLLRGNNPFEIGGVEALRWKKKGSPSMKRRKKLTVMEGSKEALQAENEYLRMENAYLKKLNAFVQSKEKSQNKTK